MFIFFVPNCKEDLNKIGNRGKGNIGSTGNLLQATVKLYNLTSFMNFFANTSHTFSAV